MKKQKNYKALGGWLMFFVIWNIIRLLTTAYGTIQNLTLLGVMEEFYFNFGISGNLLMIILSALGAFQSIMYFIIIFTIFKKSGGGDRIIKILYLTVFIASVPVFGLYITAVNGFLTADSMASFIGATIGDTFAMVVGYMYFSLSKRVKVYFGGETESETEIRTEVETETETETETEAE